MIDNVVTSKRQISHVKILSNARRAANGLKALGIEKNDTIALLLRNDFAFFEAVFAANLIDAYVVPINWHFTATEINYILNDCEAKVLVGHTDLLENVHNKLPPEIKIIPVQTPEEILNTYSVKQNTNGSALPSMENNVICNWDMWLEQYTSFEGDPSANRGNIIYTSGTTGNPKGVIRSPEEGVSAQKMLYMAERAFGFVPGEPVRTIVTGPLYHSAPNYYGIAAMRAGGFVAIQERFDAEQLLQWIENYHISHLHMVPTMFVRLLALPVHIRESYDLSSLKFVTHAAAPCSPALKLEMIQWWGPIIHEYYGGTETGGITAHNSEEALTHPGTVGRPIAGAEIRILDKKRRPLPTGEVGEIFMWHHGFPDFTYKNQVNARRDMEHQGLVSLGDLGYLDKDGYLYVCDRVRDMVISGGVNIYPVEIEGELLQIEGVKDCAVFGIPDAVMGETLCAHIELLPGVALSESEIADQLRVRLARYKIPKNIVFTQYLPREDSGKIFKRKIRDRYWKQISAK